MCVCARARVRLFGTGNMFPLVDEICSSKVCVCVCVFGTGKIGRRDDANQEPIVLFFTTTSCSSCSSCSSSSSCIMLPGTNKRAAMDANQEPIVLSLLFEARSLERLELTSSPKMHVWGKSRTREHHHQKYRYRWAAFGCRGVRHRIWMLP